MNLKYYLLIIHFILHLEFRHVRVLHVIFQFAELEGKNSQDVNELNDRLF